MAKTIELDKCTRCGDLTASAGFWVAIPGEQVGSTSQEVYLPIVAWASLGVEYRAVISGEHGLLYYAPIGCVTLRFDANMLDEHGNELCLTAAGDIDGAVYYVPIARA